MNGTKTLIIFLLICFLFAFQALGQSQPQNVEPFDTYSYNMSWEREIFYLDDLAYYLTRYPEWVAYMAFSVGDRDTLKRVKGRAERAKKYVVNKRKIDPSRLLVVCATSLENSRMSIWLVKRDDPPPKFSCG